MPSYGYSAFASVLLIVVSLSVAGAYSAPSNPLIPPPEKTRPMGSVLCFSKFEAAFTLPNQTGNPFDPETNDIEVVFHGPQGLAVTVPAFWYGDCWKVRYAPPAAGRYTLSILRNGQPANPIGLTTGRFRCIPSNDPGYIGLHTGDSQRFVFTNGQGFYPIGLNQAWTGLGLPDYPRMFAKMHACGLNWARVWMTFWDDKALDWTAMREDNPPIGQFSLPDARRIDMVMDEAAANGIYVQLVLQHHGQYTAMVDPNWTDNPANIANGGYLSHPQDFFTDPTARKLTKAKYRYIVARWGYSTHLFAYELFNEVQNIREARSSADQVADWHREMAASIRSIDFAHHMVTTSMTYGALSQIGLDFDQLHVYSNDIAPAVHDIHDTRPVFIGEFGPGGGDWGYGNMSRQILVDGLWSGITTAVAGAPEFWYWDVVEKNGWWPDLNSAARFYQESGAANETGLKEQDDAIVEDAGAPALTVQGKGNNHFALFWVRQEGAGAGAANSATLIIPSLAPGRYAAHLWSPTGGKEVGSPQLLVVEPGQTARIALPQFAGGIAGFVTSAD